MDQRQKMKHFPISKISPIANACVIEEFEESEEERFEKYAIEQSSSPPQAETVEVISRRRKTRRTKKPKVDKQFFEYNETDSDSEREHVKKIFRKSSKTYVEDESVKANARKVASVEGCPRIFAPESPLLHFQIETFPSPKDKMCRNLYPEEDNSLVEDMQEFLSSSSKIKKRPKKYAPIKCAISKRAEKPIGTPSKRLKTSVALSSTHEDDKSKEKIARFCPSPALQNVEDIDSDLSVVEATPPKIVKKYKVQKKILKNVKEFQSRSLLYSPELKKEISSKRPTFRLAFPAVDEVDETSPVKAPPSEPQNDRKTECVAKKRINFDLLQEEKKLTLENDDMGFFICSQMSAEIAEPLTPFKEMSQLCIDEYHSPPMSAYYEIENVPSPQIQNADDIQLSNDESDIELPHQIVQDNSDEEIPELQSDRLEESVHADDLLHIQDFSSPDIQPHTQEIDNASFTEICIRNTEPEQYEVRGNWKQRKKPKQGSLLEKAYGIKSRMEKDSKFFEYEIKNGLRLKIGSLVSFPLERISHIVRNGLFFIFCRTSVVENANFVIVAINVSEETLSRRFLFLHYPFTVVFNCKMDLIFLFVRNQIHSEDNFENNTIKIPFFKTKNIIRTLSTNVTSSIVDLSASQSLMPQQTLNLFILHIFWTKENFCVVCKDEKDFCVLDFREGQIEKAKSKKNIRHGVSAAVTGFHVTNISPISQDLKGLFEFSTGQKVDTDIFYTLTPLAHYWDLKTTKRTLNKIKMTTSMETVLKENDPNKRYRVNAVFVTVDKSDIFISDNLPNQKFRVVFTDKIEFKEKSLSVLDGVLFRNDQFIVDKYTQVISS